MEYKYNIKRHYETYMFQELTHPKAANHQQQVPDENRFFPEATEGEAREFAQAHSTETMAEFQGLLLALEQDWASLESIEACSQLR